MSRHALRSRVVTLCCVVGVAAGCAGPITEEVLPPEVFLADVAPLESGLFEQRVRLTLRIANPNGFDLDARGLSFDLSMNGQPLARGASNASLSVPALGEELVQVEASTTTVGLIQQLRQLAARRELSYELTGRLHLDDRMGVPFVRFDRAARLGPTAPSESAPRTLP